MTAPDCGAELVAQRMPARMAWSPTDVAWEPTDEGVHLAHRAGTTCTPAADRPRDDERSAS